MTNPAFNSTLTSQLRENIKELFRRRRLVGKLSLTFDEYINTFVPAEARGWFVAVAPYTKPTYFGSSWDFTAPNGNKVHAAIRLNEIEANRRAPPMVRDPRVQPDAPLDVMERIDHWAMTGGDASRDFGRVMKVFEFFNNNFSRVNIRYYWPTILALCSVGSGTKTTGMELQELREPAKIKPLPRPIMLACKLTAETIATAKLIPHDIEEQSPGEVTIDIVTGKQYEEPGFGTYYGLN